MNGSLAMSMISAQRFYAGQLVNVASLLAKLPILGLSLFSIFSKEAGRKGRKKLQRLFSPFLLK